MNDSMDVGNLSNTTPPSDIPRHFGADICKIVVLAVLSIVGTVGNILVIVTIQRERKLRIPGNFFIINLTFANLIITVFSMPVILSNIIGEMSNSTREYVDGLHKNGFCQTSAYLKTIALHVSWYSLAFIALNRYYTVCRMNEYANHFTKKHILITISLIWAWVVLINIPIMVGWAIPNGKTLSPDSSEGYYESYPKLSPPIVYDRSSHDCMLGVNGHGGYTYANGLFVIIIPLVAIVFCYSLVYMAMVESRRRMKSSMDTKQLKRRYRKERKISIMLTVVVLVFFICWMPAIIYDYSSDQAKLSASENDVVQLVVNWLALANCAMNSILFAAMSKAFRAGYEKIAVRMLATLVCGCCGWGRDVKDKLRRMRFSSGSSSRTIKTSRQKARTGASTVMEMNSCMTIKSEQDTFTGKGDALEPSEQNKNGMVQLAVPQMILRRKLSAKISLKPVGTRLKDPKNTNDGVLYVTEESKPNEKKIDATENNRDRENDERLSPVVVDDTSLERKRKFIPLLEKMAEDDENFGTFTEQGIYLGPKVARPNIPSLLRLSEVDIANKEQEPSPLSPQEEQAIRGIADSSDSDSTIECDRL